MPFQWGIANLTLGGWLVPARHGPLPRRHECRCWYIGPLVIAAARVDLVKPNVLNIHQFWISGTKTALRKRMVIFYCLKICVPYPVKFSWWNPKAQCDRLWREALGSALVQERKTLTEGISAFIKEITQRFPFTMWRHANKLIIYNPKEGIHQNPTLLALWFYLKNCVWSEFLLFISYPVYDILLEKAEWIENHGYSQSGSFISTWILSVLSQNQLL